MSKTDNINEKKEAAIYNLKASVEENLLEDFIENPSNWKNMMTDINKIIKSIHPESEAYVYDEFCKKIKEITKNTIDNVVDYEKIFLSQIEYEKIKKECGGNEEKLAELSESKLKENYDKNFAIVINNAHFIETLRFKLDEKFKLIEQEINNSLNRKTEKYETN